MWGVAAIQSLHPFNLKGFTATKSLHRFKIMSLKVTMSLYRFKIKGLKRHNRFNASKVHKRENFLGSDIEICTFS
jgi:hypothetical protein